VDGSRARVVLAAIVTAGALIRIPGLLHDGLWRDEAYVYVDAVAPTFREFLHRVVETEYHPPLYFLLSYAWVRLAGVSELALKVLPFLFSVLTIPAVYRLGTAAASTATGLIAAAMFAVSPLAILESGDYLYPLMGLLCTALAALVTIGRREPPAPWRFVALAIVTMLATYTHYAWLFYVPMLAAWALTSPRGVRHGSTMAAALLLGTLPFLFWLPVFLNQPNPYLVKPASNPGTPLLIPPPDAVAKLGFFAWTIVRSMPLWPEKLAMVLIAFLVLGLARVASLRRVNADAIAMGCMYAASLAFIASAGKLNVRYIAPFEGLLCVFLAWIVAAWFEGATMKRPLHLQRGGVVATATICAFILIEDVVFAAHTATLPKSGVRTFVRAGALDPATLYVVVPDYMAATFVYYARAQPVAYTAFAQFDHPEIFRYGDDARNYGPNAVRDAVTRLGKMALGFRYLDLVVEDGSDGQRTWHGRIYRSSAGRLLDALKARYSVVALTRYPGRLESITVYRFRVAHSERAPDT
jgi:4-amino-4-deoxy-L-arabinose transferase-like glycosyltransferase